MSDLLFVYGTLRSEFESPYSKMLQARSDFLGKATVPGAIYRIRHYPGYWPEPQPGTEGVVHGELYRLFPDPSPLLKALDEYEDAEFSRVRIPVRHRGVATEAWIYRYDGPLPPDSLITSGDFFA